MAENFLFYVAPRESMDLILKEGILTPREVMKRIEEGKLTKEVLGVSYYMDSSNFIDYVSLLSESSDTTSVAQAISFSRTRQYINGEFMAIGYEISAQIRELPGFVTEEETKKMNNDCYHSECLFRGKIPLEYISPHVFAARTE